MGFVEEDKSGMAVLLTPRGGNLNRDETFTICWIGNVVLNASTVVQMHSAETLNRMETMLVDDVKLMYGNPLTLSS